MEFVCFTEWSELPGSAHRLFDEGARRSVFFSRQWFENLQQTALESDQSMLLACVVDGESLLAILPLMTRNDGRLVGLSHLYSSLTSLLLVAQEQSAILECLARGLERMSILSLRLDPVSEDDRNLQLLQQAMEARGYQSHRRFRFHNWYHRLRGQSFATYMAERPSRVRNTIKRKQRKLEREQEYSIRLYTDQDLEQGLKDYDAVYRASWKANEQYQGLVEGLARSLSNAGWLRLAVLYIEGKPAAAQLWFVVHGRASIFKLVYDQAWKHYSPGSILISYLMAHVIDVDQVEEIDFLTGNDAYKQDWMSQRRQRWALTLFKPHEPKKGIARLLSALKNMRPTP